MEIAGDAARIVDPKDVKSIANGLESVFTDVSLQKKLSFKGFSHVKSFTWEKTAEEMMIVTVKIRNRFIDY